eukprot:scaffold1056_cov564-Prasinococcus_capsulatus_cf.AAC.17
MGPNPGVTRHFAGFRVGTSPSIYVIDSPGVMIPTIENDEVGLRLAATGAIKVTCCALANLQPLAEQPSRLHDLPSCPSEQNHAYCRKNACLDGLPSLSRQSESINFDEYEDGAGYWLGSSSKSQRRLLHSFYNSRVDSRERANASQQLINNFRAGQCGTFFLDADRLRDV